MNPSSKWISSLVLATAVSLFSFTSGAAERGDDGAYTKTVKTWDLDMTRSADVRALYQRVQSAAADVCAAEAARLWRNTRTRAPSGWNARCTNEAVDAAVRRIGSTQLAALHAN
jgi:UrcA family protein